MLFLTVVENCAIVIACSQASQILVAIRLSVGQTDGVQGAVPRTMAQAKARHLTLYVGKPNVGGRLFLAVAVKVQASDLDRFSDEVVNGHCGVVTLDVPRSLLAEQRKDTTGL